MDTNLRFFVSKQAYNAYRKEYEEGKLFPQMSDMFFWCVLLGFQNSPDKIPPSIGSDQKGGIHWPAFEDTIQKPMLKMIAVKATEGFQILGPDPDSGGYEKFRDVLQSYAELGFTVLNTQLADDYSQENLMGLLIDYSQKGLN